MKTKFYAAYGSNLNKIQMKSRCPDSKLVSKIMLPGWSLVFRGVADILINKNSVLNLGIYEISDKCERSLDKFEVFPILYKKKILKVDILGKTENVLTYIMNPKYGFGPPPEKYFKIIAEGFKDWGFENNFLLNALNFSIKNNTNTFFKGSYWKLSPKTTKNSATKILSQIK